MVECTQGKSTSFDHGWLVFITKQGTVKATYQDILFIEQFGSVLHIQKDREMLKLGGRISKIPVWPATPLCKGHSYLLVNVSRIHVMTKGKIVFDNQHEKHLGKNSYLSTKKNFHLYLQGDWKTP